MEASNFVLLALTGILAASVPLALVWTATGTNRYRKLAWTIAFFTFDLIVFGGFTRLTDSGLGCPDWPGCYGNASPVGAHAPITAAQSAMPSGPVTLGKAWIEMIHRYLATSVGVLIVVLAVVAWVGWARAAPRRKMDIFLPIMTLLWVCIQGAFGALTVTMKLFPAIVTLHLLGGLVLLMLLCAQLPQFDRQAPTLVMAAPLRKLVWMTLALLALQVALGGWVSTNYAVLACSDFPKCQGSWWPLMDFDQAFALWRELGMTAGGAVLSFAALTAIHYTHRLAAVIVLAALALLAWRLHRVPALRRPARWIAALAALQLVTGLSNVVLDWPLLAAVLHTGGAGALAVALTWVLAATRGHGHRVKHVLSGTTA